MLQHQKVRGVVKQQQLRQHDCRINRTIENYIKLRLVLFVVIQGMKMVALLRSRNVDNVVFRGGLLVMMVSFIGFG